MATEKKFRVVHGIVQFPPRDGEAGGKTVRNVTVRQTGFKEQSLRISATLWPSHARVEVNEGDVVTFEGAYTPNPQTKEDGTKVIYHNISVLKWFRHGTADSGEKVDVENESSEDDATDDDIPF